MTLQLRKETITLHTLPKILLRILESLAFLILRSKEYNLINIFFFKYHAENEAGRLVPDLFFLFIKLHII